MKKKYFAPSSHLLTFHVEGMLALSKVETYDNEENYGASNGLSNKRDQQSSGIWDNMETDWTK